ncbi:MFS transporter [Modestobacter muralis]|uniref:MFS transporter n=1 Tax=Modestobacter muralis TaxID=1608614 RepID=A0A6P0HFN1_9ACTN|nr:MFS transporter [Modestobacter muralis]NEK96374.1 MFS transporter [Modestobacter muralis]NEN53274.1 MFS transporter [Modestobacter muralis]
MTSTAQTQPDPTPTGPAPVDLADRAPARSAEARVQPVLTRATTLILAATTGAIAANLYYAQPLLATIAATLDISTGTVATVVTATQLAFAAGLVLVLPLGDIVERRRLLTGLLVLDAVGLVGFAVAPSLPVLLISCALMGVGNIAAQVLVPAAASLAGDAQRGRVVGTVITGLLIGMLAARTVAGVVSQLVGWRPLFLGAAVLMLLLTLVVRRVLPATGPVADRPTYLDTLRSTARLYRQLPLLRVRAAFGALGFAAFSLFWSTAALLLGGGRYSFGPAAIGGFALLGIAGAVAANAVGRLRDHVHPLPTLVAVLVIAGAFGVLLAAPHVLACMVVGIVVLDIGVQGLHVLNQRTIYELEPAARTRVNSVYMTFYFLGGSLGSAAGSLAWERAGWTGVCVTGLVISALAVVLWTATARRSPRSILKEVSCPAS